MQGITRRNALLAFPALTVLPSLSRAENLSGCTNIIDIHHGTSISLAAAKQSGVIAVIHKATEGGNFHDESYHSRKSEAKKLGLLWGSFHFSNERDVGVQVENYLAYAKPEPDEVMCLDFEDNKGHEMSLAHAEEWVEKVKLRTGRYPMLYGGAWLRGQVGKVKTSALSSCPLWYRRYASTPKELPTHIWKNYTLWQYTDGKSGAEPRWVGDIKTDRSHFAGTEAELRAAWPFTKAGA